MICLLNFIKFDPSLSSGWLEEGRGGQGGSRRVKEESRNGPSHGTGETIEGVPGPWDLTRLGDPKRGRRIYEVHD